MTKYLLSDRALILDFIILWNMRGKKTTTHKALLYIACLNEHMNYNKMFFVYPIICNLHNT